MLANINEYSIDSSFYKGIDDTANPNLLHLLANKDERYIVLVGGARSGKTYSVLQYLLYLAAVSKKKQIISVVSLNLPHLRRGAIRDFENILYLEKIPYKQNKTTNSYYIKNTIIEFFSVDDEGKVRGAQRNVLFVNEANLIDYDILTQLFMRTEKQVILDMNPTNPFFLENLINEKGLKKHVILRTTYKDNPHLSPEQVAEIESLTGIWGEVYRFGRFALDSHLVFYFYHVIDDAEYNNRREMAKVKVLGVDFGEGRSPTAVVEVFVVEGKYYAKELLYADVDLDSLLEFLLAAKQGNTVIVADSAQKHAIEYLSKKIRIYPAKKPHLASSFAILNNIKVNISSNSKNLLREAQSLKVKDTATFALSGDDHAIDALRYAVHALIK